MESTAAHYDSLFDNSVRIEFARCNGVVTFKDCKLMQFLFDEVKCKDNFNSLQFSLHLDFCLGLE